jgi:hypothetical protein
MTDLVPIPTATNVPVRVADLEDEARGYVAASRSPATMRAYGVGLAIVYRLV